MAQFKPFPNQVIRIDREYTFVKHPNAKDMVYRADGGKGSVYKLRSGDGKNWALKVFFPKHRQRRIVTINGALKEHYTGIANVSIATREIIKRPQYHDLLDEYPDLEYAVLMPWVDGENWLTYWGNKNAVPIRDTTKTFQLARELGRTMLQMEQSGIAHCDLAGSNIIVNVDQATLELIDIEDSFIPDISPPSEGSRVTGTSGYKHISGTTLEYGVWCAEGDRFASAILIAELLTWHVPDIQAAAGNGAESYYDDSDLKNPSLTNDRYRLMIDVLTTGSKEIATLFRHAWQARTLQDCPSLAAWHAALKTARPVDESIFRVIESPVLNTVEYTSDDRSAETLFSWSPVKGAKDYILETTAIHDSHAGGNKTYKCSDNRYVSKVNADGVFQARVKACSDHRESAWSKPVVFGRLPAPTLSKSVSADEIRLYWTSVPKASHYVLSIMGNATSQEDREYQTTECRIDLTAYPPGIYTVFVRAFGTIGGFQGKLVGYASNSITISVPAPKPEGLSVSKTGFNAKVTWQPVEYAVAYRVVCQPLGKSGFDALTQEVQSALADFRLPPGAYEIQVIALTEDSIPSSPAVRRETIGGLKVPHVTMTEKRKTHLLQWDNIDFAEKYRLEFARDGKTVKSADTIHCNYTIGSEWEPGTYQVRVQALTRIKGFPEAVFSEPSLPIEVSIRPPRPTWESSKVRVDETSVSLGWNKLLRVTHYRVFYRNTNSNQSEWTETNDTKIRLTLPPGTYDFWIVAHFGDVTSEDSRIQTLALETLVPVPTWVRATAEEDTTQLEWSSVKEATRYKVEFQGAIPTNTIDWDDTYLEVSLPPGAYRIRVAAYVGELMSQWSEEASVVTELAVPRILGPHQIELGQDYTIEWAEVPFAQSYQIYDYGYVHPKLEKVPDEPRNKWVSGKTRRTLMRQHHLGRMAFRVVAFWRNASGEEYLSTSDLHFVQVGSDVSPLEINLPGRVTIGEAVEISWNPHPGIAQYELEWSRDAAFSDIRSIVCDGTQAMLTFEQVGVVFVRARPQQQPPIGTWSKTSQIMIQPISPKSSSVGISGYGSWVQWDAVPNVDLYRIEWSSEPSFAAQDHQSSETRDTSALIPFPGLFARIKALTTDFGIESAWSETIALPPYDDGHLQTTFLSEDYRCSPGVPVTIEWRLVDEGIEITDPHFEVQIADTEGFENPISHNVVGVSMSLTHDETGIRFARVCFSRNTYRYAWSTVCRIQMQVEESQVAESTSDEQLSHLKPRLGGFLKNLLNRSKELQRPMLRMTISSEFIVLEWPTVPAATHYVIMLTFPNGTTKPSTPRPAGKGTEWKIPRAKLSPGVYSCRVIAIDQAADLKSEPSNTVTFQK